MTNGQTLNFASIASDTSVPASTVREYYQILEDTFIGFILPAWTQSLKRKALSTARFYLFDLGVTNTLASIKNREEGSDLYGRAFKHFIGLELRAYLNYKRIDKALTFWRTVNGIEVDFLIGEDVAVEVKSTNKVKDKHLSGLKALKQEGGLQRILFGEPR